MGYRFFHYLQGAIPLPTEPIQTAEGQFECEVCFVTSTEAVVQEGYIIWECPKGHVNRVKYDG